MNKWSLVSAPAKSTSIKKATKMIFQIIQYTFLLKTNEKLFKIEFTAENAALVFHNTANWRFLVRIYH